MQSDIESRSHIDVRADRVNDERLLGKTRHEEDGSVFGDASHVKVVVCPAELLNPVVS